MKKLQKTQFGNKLLPNCTGEKVINLKKIQAVKVVKEQATNEKKRKE